MIFQLFNSKTMGARFVGHGGSNAPPPRFCKANVKSLILTIGASPDLDCAHPVLLICPLPSFHSHRAPMSKTGLYALLFMDN